MSDDQEISFGAAIDQLVAEKGISKEKVLDTIEAALAAAYRKDYGERGQDIRAEFDEQSGQARIFKVITVVEDEALENEAAQMNLESATKKDKEAIVGKEYVEEVTPDDPHYGRVAAQTAKQVIIQRIREAEREAVFDEYKEKEGEIISGIVQRIENDTVFVDIGRTTGVLFPSEQVRGELICPHAARKLSFPAAIPACCAACLNWKCRKFLPAAWKLRALPAKRRNVPK
jgi:N utilization substance protein A